VIEFKTVQFQETDISSPTLSSAIEQVRKELAENGKIGMPQVKEQIAKSLSISWNQLPRIPKQILSRVSSDYP
jgi:hypothetical protein